MIGTSVRIAFDAKAVKAGLSQMGKLFSSFGKQIAIGGTRKMGENLTGLLGKIVGYAPDAVKGVFDLSEEMVNLSDQTGDSVDKLMQLREIMRLTGMDTGSAGKAIATMSKAIYDASRGEGPMDEFIKLGLDPKQLIGQDVISQFQEIGKAIARIGDDKEAVQSVMAAIFGGKMGYKFIPAMKDFSVTLATAKSNLSGLGFDEKFMRQIEATGDELGRWDLIKTGLTSSFMEGFFGGKSGDSTKKIMDTLMGYADQVEKIGYSLRSSFAEAFEVLGNEGIGESIKGLFRNLGSEISIGMISAMPERMKSLLGVGKNFGEKQSTVAVDQLKEAEQQTTFLQTIARKLNLGFQ